MTMKTIVNQSFNSSVTPDIKQNVTSLTTDVTHNTSTITLNNTNPYEIGTVTFGFGRGKSIYDIALEHGFEGTELDFLASLQGHSAYEVALSTGFVGTEEDWIAYLRQIPQITNDVVGFVLSNDGITAKWINISETLNTSQIMWDLGEL